MVGPPLGEPEESLGALTVGVLACMECPATQRLLTRGACGQSPEPDAPWPTAGCRLVSR